MQNELINSNVILCIEDKLNCKVTNYSHIANGSNGCVYKVQINCKPYNLAVKINKFPDLLIDEYNSIMFISDRVDCKLPKLYFVATVNGNGVLAMEYIEGSTPNFKALAFRKNKSKLANEIVDNLIKIHSVHNDKFGPINNAIYDSWYEYYSEYAKEILNFTNKSAVPKIVKNAVILAYDNLYEIVNNEDAVPTLAHGDYWIPNFIVDNKTMTLKGIIDPFNVSWTEPEYELFTLTVGYGKNLHLYDIYKSKVETTKYCNLKVELYALFNELYWYKILGKINFGYLKYRSKRLIKMIKNILYFDLNTVNNMNTLTHLGTVLLKTERLILKRISLDDSHLMFTNFACDDKVSRYMSWDTFNNENAVYKWLTEWQEEYKKADTYYWGIFLKSNNEIIGTVYLLTECKSSKVASISYCLGYDYWGNGYVCEAVKAIIDFAFNEIGFNRIEAYHAESNIQSSRVLQKVGMKKEGTLRQRYKTHIGYEDCTYYSILKDEYIKN